ncbi:pyruvate dehydrogenase kinase isozyme 2,mitochondrial [Wickerhamomyces ciferrii]|uniref:Protein-serine/threonine kinase n=1 Tax=Wickerhamomyces ciferrii (strain ATCC 14091 / BCRC 22168 / CBS 111 / JCM 3599 / NBRC 0793 / NRRL Y-1031 F-60-10) TaxID=1206466 RepID=K0L070_WICCF|nr:pyruvate dehydrogenase kinase isozyme 2,mitochondrial [Wickerhamomyces ciferrii]CCH46783.1 pyruvate dehydrogenase kinase isozyme 2,mitochondrial [Wickerhamomyces ciferrii]
MSTAIKNQIAKWAKIPPRGISLKEMVQVGQHPSEETLYNASKFIVRELPIRLAHRIDELENLPNGLNKMQSIEKVKDWYTQSFDDLLQISSKEDTGDPFLTEFTNYNRTVTDSLKKIKKRHDPTVATMAQGVVEWKTSQNLKQIDYSIQSFLDRFYMSRIGIRMLIGQHIAINDEPVRDNYVGVICTKTNVGEVARDAIDNARFICEEYYGLYEAPQVELYCPEDLTFMYVPGHLMHMLFEVLKNSLRATVETQMKKNRESPSPVTDLSDIKFPPVKLIIAQGNEDITIKVSDEGGGIARSAVPLVWTYLYTTMEDTPDLDPSYNKTDFRAPMAGFGYGLALSRLYARYFGGDLKLISMEGYGTDVYLHLNRLSTSSERLQ